MESCFRLIRLLRCPAIIFDNHGKSVFCNEQFSMTLEAAVTADGDEISQLLQGKKELSPFFVNTRSKEKVLVYPEVFDIPGAVGYKLLALADQGQHWTHMSLEKIEESRFVALGQMASGIAHEINNPLTVVLGKIHLIEKLLSNSTLTDEGLLRIRDSLAKARANVSRIAQIVKGLRNLSRDSRRDDFEEKNLNEVVQETIEMSQERLKENGILLKVSLSPEALFVRMRSYQIAQVIINLLNNAVDALSSLSLGTIEISSHQEEDYVVLRVIDNGAGVSESHEQMIMTPFFTTKPPGSGTGLGLSISRQIMLAHGGKLILNTRLSRSCFELHIPNLKGRSHECA